MIDYRKMAEYLTALADACDAVDAGKKVDDALVVEAEPVDTAAQKISASNVAIAGSGVKAELCGTVADKPTATVEILTAIGFDLVQARELIDVGIAVRSDALSLRVVKIVAEPIDVEPIGKVVR